ncbi:hypothetical protein AX15_007328 [Amanita polypyramis BW_CC]|nr:hypothetical protein AX15_007328 [Amanita polypyramis BW_CC]
MRLYISSSSHLNSSYTNDDGQTLYTVDLSSRVATIRKNLTLAYTSNQLGSSGDSVSTAPQMVPLADIKFNWFNPERIVLDGIKHEASQFLRLKRMWWPGSSDRIFTGPDGRAYQWSMDPIRLFHRDALLARFHKRSIGILNKPHPPYLEIFPEGMHMVDLIMVTFVYVLELKDRLERSRN